MQIQALESGNMLVCPRMEGISLSIARFPIKMDELGGTTMFGNFQVGNESPAIKLRGLPLLRMAR